MFGRGAKSHIVVLPLECLGSRFDTPDTNMKRGVFLEIKIKGLNLLPLHYAHLCYVHPPEVTYLKPLAVEGMKTWQIQVVSDLVKTLNLKW